jgi:hypothetical protein
LDLEIQLAAVGSDSKEKLRMFEVCGDPNSNDSAIEEHGQPYRCAIPEHPGALVPSPGALSSGYQVAAAEIYSLRNAAQRLDTYADAMQDAAFDAFLSALSNSCSAIVGAHHSGWGEKYPARHDIHVVASGPGSGKSTLARAFAVALQRETKEQPFPLGSVFLVHHIETAHKAYQELSALLPGKVAVFTTKHDAERDHGYPNRYAVEDLEAFPILVVTHEFYMGLRGERARYYKHNGLRLPRVLTFIDEKVNEIDVHDLNPAAFENVLAYVQDDQHASPEIVKAMHALRRFSLEPDASKTTLLQRLIYVLADVGEATEVSTKIIAERLGDTWRNISGNLSKTKGWKGVAEGIGWTYHGGSGSRPGCFRRDTGALVACSTLKEAMLDIATLLRHRSLILCGKSPKEVRANTALTTEAL